MIRRNKVQQITCVKWFVLLGIVFLIMPGMAFSADFPKDVTVISPSAGASVHMVQVGIGKAVKKFTPIENWIVQPLGGPKLWLPQMKSGRIHFANHNAADLVNAYLGRSAFKKMGPMPMLRMVGAGHDYMFMFWTTPDTGIETIADLKGKTAYISFKANPMFTEMAKNQLGSAGLTLKDLKGALAFSSVKEAIRGLIEGRVDAIMFPVVPGAVMQVNEAKGECKFVKLSKQQAQYVVNQMEGYTVQDIAANDPRFRNLSAVPNAISYQNAMFTSEKMDSDVVYEVTKAIYDHNDEYKDTHPAAKYWSLDHHPVAFAVPYHPGSIKYFKEKGLWTQEAQAYQDKILKRAGH